MIGRWESPCTTGNGGQVEEIAGGGVEAADAALAENHVGIAFGQDVFGREQQLLDRGREAALEQDRLPQPAGPLEQRIVLHVARADLDDVGDLGDLVERPRDPSPR